MGFSYKPLWKLLIDRNMNKVQMRDALGLSPTTRARLGRDEYVSMDVLDRICEFMDCRIEDVVQHVSKKHSS